VPKHLRVPENLRMAWLPPYGPECNLVEHLWDEIREKSFHNRVFESLDAVEDTLVVALTALEHDPQKVHGLTGFDWIICCPMIAT